jgi:hypothetical protein
VSLVTIAAMISNGRILPDEPEKVPETGRALVTILAANGKQQAPTATIAELMRDLAGTGNGAFSDLSTNKSHLDNFDQ